MPPVGLPPVNVNTGALIQTENEVGQVTDGSAFTVRFTICDGLHVISAGVGERIA